MGGNDEDRHLSQFVEYTATDLDHFNKEYRHFISDNHKTRYVAKKQKNDSEIENKGISFIWGTLGLVVVKIGLRNLILLKSTGSIPFLVPWIK